MIFSVIPYQTSNTRIRKRKRILYKIVILLMLKLILLVVALDYVKIIYENNLFFFFFFFFQKMATERETWDSMMLKRLRGRNFNGVLTFLCPRRFIVPTG